MVIRVMSSTLVDEIAVLLTGAVTSSHPFYVGAHRRVHPPLPRSSAPVYPSYSFWGNRESGILTPFFYLWADNQ